MIFKRCPACGIEWPTRDDLLSDPDIKLLGYQVNFKDLATGIFLFNHCCKGTLGLYAVEFEDLYDGPIFQERYTGGSECPGHCMHHSNLKPCPAKCECAYVREVIQQLKAWPKRAQRAACQTG